MTADLRVEAGAAPVSPPFLRESRHDRGPRPGRSGPLRTMLGFLDDAVLLLLVILLFPLGILLVGTPVALLVRVLIQIARRL
ncbi:MAG TPA: hypothetical protein VM818_24335 [Vicinamibacterales bacterium]|nr:hypothetical protein [Vicinamibacterales bacterium]